MYKLFFIVFLFSSLAQADIPTGIETDWQNERGSRLLLKFQPDGSLTGTFTTSVGCGANIPRKVVGHHNGNSVAFIVDFKECKAMTVWNGHLNETGQQLDTLWILTQADRKGWDAYTVREDRFKRRQLQQ